MRVARACHDDSVALAVFPELALSGYSIEDILLQDALLDAVEEVVVVILFQCSDDGPYPTTVNWEITSFVVRPAPNASFPQTTGR